MYVWVSCLDFFFLISTCDTDSFIRWYHVWECLFFEFVNFSSNLYLLDEKKYRFSLATTFQYIIREAWQKLITFYFYLALDSTMFDSHLLFWHRSTGLIYTSIIHLYTLLTPFFISKYDNRNFINHILWHKSSILYTNIPLIRV